MGVDLGSILGGGLIGEVKGIISSFKLDPETKAKIDAAVDERADAIKLKEIEMQEQIQTAISAEVQAASANIQAEAKSGDKYTSRARPTFMYVFNIILLMNYVVLPQIRRDPVSFPDSLFWLGGACILGYTGARSWDKWAEKIANK